MGYELEGELHCKFETEQKGNTSKSRDFVIKTSGEYPQLIKFQLVQDRCESIDTIDEGTQMRVYFDLRGREWNGKYFTNLQAWKIDASDLKQNYGSKMANAADNKNELPF